MIIELLQRKNPEDFTREEAKQAYEHLVRNMAWDDIHALENAPEPREGDSEFIAVRKRVFRRLRALGDS